MMDVALHCELLEAVKYLKYVRSKIITDEGIETEVKCRINDVGNEVPR